MAQNHHASQFDKAYRPNKLGNWEVPDTTKVAKAASPASPSHKTADGRTIPIVNERGHIVTGAKKAAAFATQPEVWKHSPPRWPHPNPTFKGSAAATMGYKGIPTSYLPRSTVPLKTVEAEGCQEFNYAGGLH